MSDRFDPEIVFRIVPSIYKDQLPASDIEFLNTLWDGLIRCIDAEYAHALQVADSLKIDRAPILTFYPWIRHEATWATRKARHQHTVMRLNGSAGGIFIFPRFVDESSIKVYYNGTRRLLNSPSLFTNDLNASQLYKHYFSFFVDGYYHLSGSRIELRSLSGTNVVPDTSFAAGAEVVLESSEVLCRNRFSGDGNTTAIPITWYDGVEEVSAVIDPNTAKVNLTHQCLWMSSTYALTPYLCPGRPGTVGVTIDSVSAEHPTITNAAGFVVGQVIEIVRFDVGSQKAYSYRETITENSQTYTVRRSRTDSHALNIAVVNLVLDIPLFPTPVVFESFFIRLSKPFPAGLRLRIEDPAGAQFVTTDGVSSSFRLEREIDPDTASAFVFNVDLTAVSVEPSLIDLGRPIQAACIVEYSASYWTEHDHARFSTILLSSSATVALPISRPLAVQSSFSEDPLYPIKVYRNGILLKSTDYSFTNTVTIQKASGTFTTGDRIDVVYVDLEEVEDHIHRVQYANIAANGALSAITFDEITDRYPVCAEVVSGTLLREEQTNINLNQIVQITPAVSGAASVFIEGAHVGDHFETLIPARVDVDEHYEGRLVSAESAQDGIDVSDFIQESPTLVKSDRNTIFRSSSNPDVVWFKNSFVDEHLIQNNLGVAVGLLDDGESDLRYKNAVISLVAASWSPSTTEVIENFACIILGSEFAPEGRFRGVSINDQSRFFRLDTPTGEHQVGLHKSIADRVSGSEVPRFFAVSSFARVLSTADVPWMPFFAEHFSETFRAAKRLDVRKPREVSGDVTSFDSMTLILTASLARFITWEVWTGDVIRLTVAGSSTFIYGRVVEVISETELRLNEAPPVFSEAGWGDLGFGSTTGWGGYLVDADVTDFMIWTRETRQIDAHLFFDEPLSQTVTLTDGEIYEIAQERLSTALGAHVFGLRLDWDALSSQKALRYLKVFLNRVRPAETQAVVYAECNNGAIVDKFSGGVGDHGISVNPIPRSVIVGYSFVGYSFVAPSLVEVPVEPAMLGPDWWLA